MYILILIVLLLIAGAIISIAWPLIVFLVGFLAVCLVLSILRDRQKRNAAEKNIINADYTVREDDENDSEA